ncbi:hypothetical protein U1Q18_009026, partial [Sarracenia purpurea var. burkii]
STSPPPYHRRRTGDDEGGVQGSVGHWRYRRSDGLVPFWSSSLDAMDLDDLCL